MESWKGKYYRGRSFKFFTHMDLMHIALEGFDCCCSRLARWQGLNPTRMVWAILGFEMEWVDWEKLRPKHKLCRCVCEINNLNKGETGNFVPVGLSIRLTILIIPIPCSPHTFASPNLPAAPRILLHLNLHSPELFRILDPLLSCACNLILQYQPSVQSSV